MSKITIGYDLTEQIKSEIANDDIFVVTDDRVYSLYGSLIGNAPHYIIPSGEQSKTLEEYAKVMEEMLKSGCNRKTTVVALGGGVVGDLAGFVASTYMRGIKWINIPTTLLSQVDSSVGGKTAVNLGSYKNIVGAFHLPEKVLVSTHFLFTLPPREWLCGVGEIVKTAFLSKEVEELVYDNLALLLTADEEITYKTVSKCIEYKKDIVEKDFKETGLRKVLNLGHTVGHAIESVDNYQRSHGEYVILGMSAEFCLLSDRLGEEIKKKFDYIDTVCGVLPVEFDEEEVAKACLKDKKNGDGKISVMLADYENTREVLLDYDEVLEGLKKWKLSL